MLLPTERQAGQTSDVKLLDSSTVRRFDNARQPSTRQSQFDGGSERIQVAAMHVSPGATLVGANLRALKYFQRLFEYED